MKNNIEILKVLLKLMVKGLIEEDKNVYTKIRM